MDEHQKHIDSGQSYKCDCEVCQKMQMGTYKPDRKRVSWVSYLSHAMTAEGKPISSVGHKKPHYRAAQ